MNKISQNKLKEFYSYTSMWAAKACSSMTGENLVKFQLGRADVDHASGEKGSPNTEDVAHEVSLRRVDGANIDFQYAHWIGEFDKPSTVEVRQLVEEIAKQKTFPMISIVMPTYNSDVRFLNLAIESVRRQLYPFWELCIVDDASTDPDVVDALKQHALIDRRIRLVLSAYNSGISGATNQAIDEVSGDWVCFMDHDDELHPLALARVVASIRKSSDIELIYTDEDKITEDGVRCSPHFKTNYNYELLLSQNYFCHLVCIRNDLLQRTGRLNSNFDGAQDYEFVLRLIENTDPKKIYHLAKICYHWRILPNSTSSTVDAKPAAIDRAVEAVSEHLQRRGVVARVCNDGIYNRVKFMLPSPSPMVSIVIPTKNKRYLLERCVNSVLEKTVYENFELVVVDNGSDESDVDEFYQEVKNRCGEKLKIISAPVEFNFSTLVNIGVDQSDGEYVVLLNNDTEVIEPLWLNELVSVAAQPSVGAVGAKLLYSNGLVQHAGVVLGIGGVAGHSHKFLDADDGGYFGRAKLLRAASAVTGACLMIKRAIWQQLGGFDERLKVAFNDVDFCIRVLKAGYRNVFSPHALLFHHESVSRGYEDTAEKMHRFNSEVKFMLDMWGDDLKCDVYHNPNLSLTSENYELAFPPL